MNKKNIINFLKKEIRILSDLNINLEKLIEVPKKKELGDFSLPLFILSKNLKKNPVELSKEFESILNKKKPEIIKEIKAQGPFLNFYINYNIYANKVFKDIFNFKFKKINISNDKIIIEYPSPNTNKSLHVGHVRNILIGNSLINILKRVGYNVIHTNLNNDRGISICQAMLAYEKYGDDKTPKETGEKPDKFAEKFYVLFNKKVKKDPKLQDEALEMLKKWENGDEKTIELWKKFLSWVYEGYKITYENYKLPRFDKEYFESEIYDKGKEIVLNALKNKVKGFKKDETGGIYYDFEDKTYGKKYLLRPNGTTLYMTQDLYLAKLKKKDFSPKKSIFVVGKDQQYHFEVLFKLFGILGISKEEENFHFAYGFVFDKDGKKFSSRKGGAFGADDFLDLVIKKAKENLENKEFSKNLSKKELEKRAKIIGFGALSFSILKVNPLDDIKFDIDKALSFEGDSGPYILYTYARIKSIIRKSNLDIEKIKKEVISDDFFTKFENKLLISEKEKNLISIIKEYEGIIIEVSEKFKISLIPNFLIKLSKEFNNYYNNIKILDGNLNEIKFKLVLIYSISEILKDGLSFLNIDVLEEM